MILTNLYNTFTSCNLRTYYTLVLVSVFLLFSPHFIIGDVNNQTKRLQGKVIKQEDGTALANAHVINLTRVTGTSTLNDGSFKITVSKGDSIMFQSVGFKNDTLFIDEKLYREKDHVVIALEKKIYVLPGIDIFPYATYAEFKQAFIHFDDDKVDTVPSIDLDLPEQLYLAPTSEGAGIRMTGPISFLYDQFSQRGREKRKYAEIKEEERKEKRISRLVNHTSVRMLTGLEDDEEIDEFLDYCNLSYEFIVNSKEYQVYQAIIICYENYKYRRRR